MAKKKQQPLKDLTNLYITGFLLLTIPALLYGVVNFTGLMTQAKRGQGHGAPKGAHYNLNIIGVPKTKSADMTGAKGHRIFVSLTGKTKINLAEGSDFEVLDANGTDGVAEFMLPNPDPDNDGVTEYSVWARALGKPGGSSKTTTCAYDADGTEWCSIYSMVLVRTKGKSKFTDVSKELLYVYVDLDADGEMERYPLFDEALMDYFWDYDNNGLKLAQLRFYPGEPSDVR